MRKTIFFEDNFLCEKNCLNICMVVLYYVRIASINDATHAFVLEIL